MGLACFIILFEVGLVLLGGGVFTEGQTNPGWLDIISILLLFLGSYLNSFSELQRKWWKQKQDN